MSADDALPPMVHPGRRPGNSHEDPSAERGEMMERGKIMLGRTPVKPGQPPGPLWWRVTIYVGDGRADIDAAMDEALRVDERFRGLLERERGRR